VVVLEEKKPTTINMNDTIECLAADPANCCEASALKL
jgi:hypothetical protein